MANKFNRSTIVTKTDSKASRKKNIKPHYLKKTGQQVRDKEQRREEAEVRNSVWAKLTPKQQLVNLAARGMIAKKQVERIIAKTEV